MVQGDVSVKSSKPTGKALEFDGINDYMNVTDAEILRITNDITMLCWVKITDLAKPAGIMGKGHALSGAGRGYYLTYFAGTNALYFDTFDSVPVRDALVKTNIITDNDWHHVAVTWNGTKSTNGKKMYVDGILVNQRTSLISEIGTPADDFKIGIDGDLVRPAAAIIDSARIYNRELSITEIIAIKNLKTITNKGLVGSWSFNNTPVTGKDDSGNGNNGTIIGALQTGGYNTIEDDVTEDRVSANDKWGFIPIAFGEEIMSIHIEEA